MTLTLDCPYNLLTAITLGHLALDFQHNLFFSPDFPLPSFTYLIFGIQVLQLVKRPLPPCLGASTRTIPASIATCFFACFSFGGGRLFK